MKKPIYGLDDTSRKFWLRVKEVFYNLDMKMMDGDEAFYFLHQGGLLQGCVITHIDDFTIAGKKEFIDRVLNLVEIELTVLKIEKDNFH